MESLSLSSSGSYPPSLESGSTGGPGPAPNLLGSLQGALISLGLNLLFPGYPLPLPLTPNPLFLPLGQSGGGPPPVGPFIIAKHPTSLAPANPPNGHQPLAHTNPPKDLLSLVPIIVLKVPDLLKLLNLSKIILGTSSLPNVVLASLPDLLK